MYAPDHRKNDTYMYKEKQRIVVIPAVSFKKKKTINESTKRVYVIVCSTKREIESAAACILTNKKKDADFFEKWREKGDGKWLEREREEREKSRDQERERLVKYILFHTRVRSIHTILPARASSSKQQVYEFLPHSKNLTVSSSGGLHILIPGINIIPVQQLLPKKYRVVQYTVFLHHASGTL